MNTGKNRILHIKAANQDSFFYFLRHLDEVGYDMFA